MKQPTHLPLRASSILKAMPKLKCNVKICVPFIVGDLTGKYVIEVGPGPGGITRACLAANAKQVLVIEKDPRFIPSLKLLQEASGGPDRLRINIGDCLHYNVESKLLVARSTNDFTHTSKFNLLFHPLLCNSFMKVSILV